MDTNNNGQTPATDDQELAQVLAGMNQQAAEQPAADAGLQFEETGATPPAVPDPAIPVPGIAPEPAATTETEAAHGVSALTPELEAIKKDALEQLRPLVDKLDLPAEERFDTLLLIIRSTDDQSLLTAANEAAKSIEDESKRAEALLDVIKEIDFFSGKTA